MKARILVVEDEAIVQLDLQHRLQQLGYSVVGLASRGEDAVIQAAELTPDLVLMDIRLGGSMDGVEAARQIQATRPIPVIYLTAYKDISVAGRSPATLQPCLSKPFRKPELAAAITQALCLSEHQ